MYWTQASNTQVNLMISSFKMDACSICGTTEDALDNLTNAQLLINQCGHKLCVVIHYFILESFQPLSHLIADLCEQSQLQVMHVPQVFSEEHVLLPCVLCSDQEKHNIGENIGRDRSRGRPESQKAHQRHVSPHSVLAEIIVAVLETMRSILKLAGCLFIFMLLCRLRYNKVESDFAVLLDYNDYQEEKEDVIYQLVHNIDRPAVEARVKAYQQAHEDEIRTRLAQHGESDRVMSALVQRQRADNQAAILEVQVREVKWWVGYLCLLRDAGRSWRLMTDD